VPNSFCFYSILSGQRPFRFNAGQRPAKMCRNRDKPYKGARSIPNISFIRPFRAYCSLLLFFIGRCPMKNLTHLQRYDLISFHNLYLFLAQPIQLINHFVNLFVGGVDLVFDVQGFFRFLNEIIFPFGFLRQGEFYFTLFKLF
jgi:hypothetical protein